jgi:hypothetical protein
MNACDWIICERTGRWAAAMRVGAARRSSQTGPALRIYEVRSLDELAERLALRPLSLVLLEVHNSNLAKQLQWLAHNSQRFPRALFVALLDRMLTARLDSGSERSSGETLDVVSTLLESGAAEIAVSPRRLQHIFSLAGKHSAGVRPFRRPPIEAQSIMDWAHSQLPWQTDRGRE